MLTALIRPAGAASGRDSSSRAWSPPHPPAPPLLLFRPHRLDNQARAIRRDFELGVARDIEQLKDRLFDANPETVAYGRQGLTHAPTPPTLVLTNV